MISVKWLVGSESPCCHCEGVARSNPRGSTFSGANMKVFGQLSGGVGNHELTRNGSTP